MCYKLRLIITSIIFCTISYCNAQIKLSEAFKKDIKSTCSICKEDANQFYVYHEDNFHLAHFFYQKKNIDSSFTYVINLLHKEEDLETRKKYVLYYLKGIILEYKSLEKASSSSFNHALTLAKNDSFITSTNGIYRFLSKIYINQKKYDSAIVLLETWNKSYDINQSSKKAAINFHNLGISYLHLENYKKAEIHLLKSDALNNLSKDTLNLAYSSIDLANLYYEQYKDSLAIVYFKKGLAYAKKSNDLTILQSAYKNMAVVEKNRKAYKTALFYQEAYSQIKDSIWNRDNIWKLAETDKAIATAVANEKLVTEKNKTKRILQFSGLLLLLLFISSIAGYKINKQRKLISNQKNDLEDLHKLKDDLFAILGHDLRAPMHHILHLNKQMRSECKQIKAPILSNLITKNAVASNKMQLILDNILQWILLKNKQGYFEKELVNASRIVKLVVFDFVVLLQHKSIKHQIVIDKTIMVFADSNALKVILRNVLDNAIKFTPEFGSIIIKGTTKNTTTTISIEDTGIGMETNTKKIMASKDTTGRKSTGLGLGLCQSFTKRNNGSFKIESKKGVGTNVLISLPNIKT